jgi:hypothetical protein
MTESLRIKTIRETFRILKNFSGKIRPIESRKMFELYEKEIVKEITSLPEKIFYNSFTETFGSDADFQGFSSRYNRSLEMKTNDSEGSKTLTWGNISTHGLIANKVDYSFIRLTIKDERIIKIEYSHNEKSREEFQDLQNPKYSEIGPDILNRWYFLEFVHKEILEIKQKNQLFN